MGKYALQRRKEALQMKRIVLTGGGTAGHVTPNLALKDELEKQGYEVFYIGSYKGIEKELIEKEKIPYYGISSGKLRRYFDLKNFMDPFRVLKGIFQARRLLRKIKPDVIFSKGGYVAVPVVLAAKKRHIPCVIHESDLTPGLANKICIPCATKVCANFPETMRFLPTNKAVLTGTPIRKELYMGDKETARTFCGFEGIKPVLMFVGGSTGAGAINTLVSNILPTLLKNYDVVHLCGKGKRNSENDGKKGYIQLEYASEQMKDLLALADIVISRAGANAVCELVALKKPHILIPLPALQSRGDQVLNAESFEKQGFSYVLYEENLTNETFLEAVKAVFEEQDKYIANMEKSEQKEAASTIVNTINEVC